MSPGKKKKMQTILELLSEIKWSGKHQAEDFELGYYDRVDQCIVRVRLGNMEMDSSDKFAFTLREESGRTRTIPYHRIKRVWKKGELVWKREVRAPLRLPEED